MDIFVGRVDLVNSTNPCACNHLEWFVAVVFEQKTIEIAYFSTIELTLNQVILCIGKFLS